MKIGIEVSALATTQPTGIARYANSFIEALKPGPNDSVDLLYSLSRRKNKAMIPDHGHNIRGYYGNLYPFKKDVDVIHGLDNKLPNWKSAKKLITVHDLLIHINRADLISPRAFREKKLKELDDIFSFVDGVITVSHKTKDDVVNLFGFPEEKTFVTHLGVDYSFFTQNKVSENEFRTKMGLEEDYLLFVGAISGRKNTVKLVEAYNRSGLKDRYQLVLAGSVSYMGHHTIEKIKELKLENRVKILNYVEESMLPALYSNASSFVFPTLYEGFGLPLLEAMCCNVPVLSSSTGSAPEILQEHGVVVYPHDVDAIAEGMNDVLKVGPEQLKRAHDYAKTFTWERCAKQTLDVYRTFAEGEL